MIKTLRSHLCRAVALVALILSSSASAVSTWRAIADGTTGTPTVSWNSVWASEDADVWVVGDSGNIMHWNGSTWATTPSGTVVKLRHVWGLNSSTVYAVGDSGTILKWNGSSWSAQTSGISSAVTGIWGRAGNDLYASTLGGDTLRSNGTTWTKGIALVQPQRSVWGNNAASPSSVFYVGDLGGLNHLYIASFSSSGAIGSPTLYGVWGTGDDNVWAVGAGGNISHNLGFGSFTNWLNESLTTTQNLLSVAGVDKNNVWTVGGSAVYRYTGTKWISDASVGAVSNATGVWATSVNSVFITSSTGIVWVNSPATVGEISVEQPVGSTLASKGTVDFGAVVNTAPITKTFVIKSQGVSALTGLAISKSGIAAADYTVTALSSTSVATGGSTTFDVNFLPSADGARPAVLSIASNDVDESPFVINLTATGRLAPSVTSLTSSPAIPTVNPNAAVSFTVVAKGSPALTYQWQYQNPSTMTWANAPGVSNTAKYSIAHATEASEGGYHVIITNSYGTVTSGDITLSVNNAVILSPAAPTPQLTPLARVSGTSASFTVNVANTATLPLTYVWQRNGATITGATVTSSLYSNTFTIPGVNTANGGDISCLVKNVASSSGVTTNKANLTVVEGSSKTLILPTGGTATLTVATGGTVSGYLWKKNGGSITPDSDHAGITTKTLTIKHLLLSDDDTYTCDVTGPGGTATSGVTDLIVYDSAPALASMVSAPLDMGTAIVSGDYAYDINAQLDAASTKTPTTFSCTNLPPGLKCNATTGVITGKPAVAIPAVPGTKTYTVVITASNAKGKLLAGTPLSTLTGTLVVQALPTDLAGDYVGRIERTTSTALDSGRGGRLDLNVTTTGTYTGTLTLGATPAISLKGALNTTVSSTIASHTLVIPAKAPHPQLTLNFTIDASQNLITSASVTDGTTTANLTKGWRNKWKLAPTTSFAGLHTFKLTGPGSSDLAAPQGHGYGYFTPANTGTVSVTGVLADGFPYTTSGVVGPNGEVLLFKVVTATDSLGGVLKMASGGDNAITTDPLAIDWARAPQAASATVYKTGFGLGIAGHALVNLTASGAKYTPPPPAVGVTPAGVLLQATNDASSQNAQFAFTGAELGDTAKNPLPYPDFSVRLSAPAKVNSLLLVTAPVLPIKRTVPVPTVSATSGLFSGSFTLYDPRDPGLSTGDLFISRTAKYAGIVIFEAGVPKGYGYFLLGNRPVTAVEKVTTTDQLSGVVTFSKTL